MRKNNTQKHFARIWDRRSSAKQCKHRLGRARCIWTVGGSLIFRFKASLCSPEETRMRPNEVGSGGPNSTKSPTRGTDSSYDRKVSAAFQGQFCVLNNFRKFFR